MSNTLPIPQYPEIHIPLIGEDGNAFAILARVRGIMRKEMGAELFASEWDNFHTEATSGDYDNLLRTIMRWFTVEDEE